jgi:hypothetical protein
VKRETVQRDSKRETAHRNIQTLDPQPSTLNPQPSTLTRKHQDHTHSLTLALPQHQDPKHKWCKGTYAAYKAIIEQLEKYWVLAIVHTSARSIPPQVTSPYMGTSLIRHRRPLGPCLGPYGGPRGVGVFL